MTVTPTEIPQVLEIIPDVFTDERGEFLEAYNKDVFASHGITVEFVQDNVSVSTKGVLRGLHFQKEPYAQDKLVSVVAGEVFDVAVDLRRDSPTRGRWVGRRLSAEQHTMLFIPKGFAHGFYVLSEQARFSYKCSAMYNKDADGGVRFDDPEIGIQWPIEGTPIISAKDQALPLLRELEL